MISIRILYTYFALSALIIFCTFWLSTSQEFRGFAVGYASFSSVVIVLNRFAEIIAFSDGKLRVNGWQAAIQVGIGGFMKFLFPPILIYWGIRSGFSIIFMVAGLVAALTAIAASLAIYNQAKSREK